MSEAGKGRHPVRKALIEEARTWLAVLVVLAIWGVCQWAI